eukprot:1974014-Prorocentrum_lima.AAC.1
MTSSLVGSEMCIRDRATKGTKAPACKKKRRRGIGPRGGVEHKGAATRTVSYTHLTLPTICSV